MQGRIIFVATLAALGLASWAVLGQSPGKVAAESSTSMKAGTAFKECLNCPEMVVIPAGKFVMGTSAAATTRRCRRDFIGAYSKTAEASCITSSAS